MLVPEAPEGGLRATAVPHTEARDDLVDQERVPAIEEEIELSRPGGSLRGRRVTSRKRGGHRPVPIAPDELSTCRRTGKTFSRNSMAPSAASRGSPRATRGISATASLTRVMAGWDFHPNAPAQNRPANAQGVRGPDIILGGSPLLGSDSTPGWTVPHRVEGRATRVPIGESRPEPRGAVKCPQSGSRRPGAKRASGPSRE